jgi:hypothetical protein
MTSFILTALAASAFISTADAAGPLVGPAPMTLSLVPPGVITDTEVLAPEQSDGQVLAGRLQAGDEPFSVRSVSYELVGASLECDSGMGHTVRVWKSPALRPGAQPIGIQEYKVPARPDAGSRMVSIPLGQYIQLDRGESLFVAVELQQEGETGMCIAAVSEAPKDKLRQFVSPTLQTPYRWTSFDRIEAEVTMDIKAIGYVIR